MERLDNTIQPYAWGSRTALATLMGRPSPSPGPEAELWMGAHRIAPSQVRRGAERLGLDAVLTRDPERELGARCRGVHGDRLPFLLKVLAAAQPLSLQAHPSQEQARAGFAREEAEGVPIDAPTRNYRDENHKPELLCALGPFDALCGFRDPAESLSLFESLQVPALKPVSDALRHGDAGLSAAFEHVLRLPNDARDGVVRATLAACARTEGPFADERAWAVRLGELYPGDAGIICALLLNLVHLEDDDAIFLPAGNLHAYLGGVGVEIMASSDNVLRGGLTPKHVDVDELCAVLEFRSGPIEVLSPRDVAEGEREFFTPTAEFRLSIVELGERELERQPDGPEILLCIGEHARLAWSDGKLDLRRGEAAFVRGTHPAYRMSGTGRVYRARTGPDNALR